jgi:hypothetical protein
MSPSRLLTTTFAVVLLLAGSAGATDWSVPGDFPTIQAAIDSASVADGDAILVSAGAYTGATVTKAVTIRATGVVSIVDGPVVGAFGKAGFYFPGGGQGSGATITGFSFDGMPLPIFSRGADDVTVMQNTLSVFLQGITNWGYGSWGNRWQITDNTLQNPGTSCGGGIGIFVGDFEGGSVSGNVITRNTVTGQVRVPAADCGGYNAPAITLYADFRGGALGATITGNLVTKNVVSLRSVTPRRTNRVTFSGVELADTRDDWATYQPGAVRTNVVNYNDLRQTGRPFAYTPDEQATVNTIENNYTAPGYILNDQPGFGVSTLGGPAGAPIR